MVMPVHVNYYIQWNMVNRQGTGPTETMSIKHVGQLTTFPFIVYTLHPCVFSPWENNVPSDNQF